MTLTVEQQVLIETGSAYLIVDPDLRIKGAGGLLALVGGKPPIGAHLIDLLPELFGNEQALAEILSGDRDRLSLPMINRQLPDGSVLYLDLLTVPLMDDRGNITGLIQIITDTTHRSISERLLAQRRNELQLLKDRIQRQNVELARINAGLLRVTKLKDEFLASMSHEVRTPLTAILGLVDVLRAQLVGPLSDEQLGAINGIKQGGQHLLSLINDYLDIAKIEAGRLELDIGPVSVQDVCQSFRPMVADLARRAKLELIYDLDPSVQVILADARRLRQILINLLSNAIKFTPAGGKVGLEVRGEPERGAVRFTVWDTGIGIAPEDAARLFEPFQQIENERQQEVTGSGLGLALVSKLTRLHGGSVSLESEVGFGSRFHVSLPWEPDEQKRLLEWFADERQKEREAELPNDLPPASPLAGDRPLLMVEDDVATATLFAQYLTRCGYRVVHVESGEEALAYVQGEMPCLVLLDVRMRTMDGIEVMRHLRADVATRDLPILVLTALAMPGDRERCLAAGADDYLAKPVRLRQLAERIAALLEQKR
ncbi:hybrid sensor histidine kinase/response regulator [Chloroflexus sp.]|uniref:ATP-binding response regulator n=1 Tax=Chloroflexus sp. TaxID=1904827 RepID=UPI002ACEE6CB|nr:ATP-binding protein [Chloroflexus sp.]